MRVIWTEEALADQPGVTLWIAALELPQRDERVHLASIRAVEGAFLPPHRETFWQTVDRRVVELRLAPALRSEVLAVLAEQVERPTRGEVTAFADRLEARLRT
jgi:hypothetical protein